MIHIAKAPRTRDATAARIAPPGFEPSARINRLAGFSPTSYSASTRSVDAVLAAGAPVSRGLGFVETLNMDPASIDLSRGVNGRFPLADTHNVWSIEASLGFVDNVRVEAGQLLGRLNFADTENGRAAEGQVARGEVTGVSIGYWVRTWTNVSVDDGTELWRADKWQLAEASLCLVPADPGAGVRSAPQASTGHSAPTQTLENDMTRSAVTAVLATPAVAAVEVPVAALPAAAAVAETRAAPAATPQPVAAPAGLTATTALTLARLGESFGLRAEVETMISTGLPETEIRSQILERAAARQQANIAVGGPRASITRDEGDTRRLAVEAAIFLRANPGMQSNATAEGRAEVELAREWRGMRLIDMARTYIEESSGVRLRGLAPMEMASRALGMSTRDGGQLGTSDFPYILANVVNRRLRDAYGSVLQTWKPLCRQAMAPDFRDQARVAMSGLPTFVKVKEGAEYTYASFGDLQEKYALATYGRIINITRQAIINDDLGAFNRMPEMIGRGAGELENTTVWSIFIANANMADGNALFSAAHKNYVSSGLAPTVASVQAMEQLMLEQIDLSGVTPLNLMPKFLVVTPKNKVAAQQILGAIQPNASTAFNPYVNAMQLIVEARLKPSGGGAEPWFMVGDPGMYDTVEYAYLDGQEGVFTDTRIGFEVDGVEIKGRLDFAAKAIDWRNMTKQIGV